MSGWKSWTFYFNKQSLWWNSKCSIRMSLLLYCCTTFYRSYLLAWFHPHLQMMMRMKITTHGEKAKTRGYLSEKIVSILLILFKVLASELNILADSQFFARWQSDIWRNTLCFNHVGTFLLNSIFLAVYVQRDTYHGILIGYSRRNSDIMFSWY